MTFKTNGNIVFVVDLVVPDTWIQINSSDVSWLFLKRENISKQKRNVITKIQMPLCEVITCVAKYC